MFTKIVATIIAPLGTALLLGLVALVLAWLGKKRSAFCCAAFSLGWLLLWSMPVVNDGLVHYVESRIHPVPIQQLPPASAIVVLGGVMSGTRWPSDIGQPADLGSAADRVWHGARFTSSYCCLPSAEALNESGLVFKELLGRAWLVVGSFGRK